MLNRRGNKNEKSLINLRNNVENLRKLNINFKNNQISMF